MGKRLSISLRGGSTMSSTFFADTGCVVVREFIDPLTIKTVSRYMENMVNHGAYSLRDSETSKFSKYSDPLIELVLEDSKVEVEKVVGRELYPTYSFARLYMDENELKSHTDRPSCEYSVTVNVATVGELWPIQMKNLQGVDLKVVLNPGDAIIYKGCEVLHWRDPMFVSNTKLNAQFMLHYVDKKGPFSDYKFDKRPKLGLAECNRGT
jgi:hypothetical protein